MPTAGVRVSPFAADAWIFADDVHAPHDLSERGKSLPVGLPRAAEVERGLIPDADRKRVACGIGRRPGHRERTVRVLQAGHARPLQRDGRKKLASALAAARGLDDRDLDGFVHLVVGADDAKKRPPSKSPASTYFRKLAAVIGARTVSISASISPASVSITTRTAFGDSCVTETM
jgi:hypothetical protein